MQRPEFENPQRCHAVPSPPNSESGFETSYATVHDAGQVTVMQARFSIRMTNQKKIWIREELFVLHTFSYTQYSNKVRAQQSQKAEHHASRLFIFIFIWIITTAPSAHDAVSRVAGAMRAASQRSASVWFLGFGTVCAAGTIFFSRVRFARCNVDLF